MSLVRSLLRFGPVVLATGPFLLATAPMASAAPDDTSVAAYRLPCGQAVCDEDHRIGGDDIVGGTIQLQAETSSAIGLRSVEVQIQVDGTWRCIERWTTSARNGRWHTDVDPGTPLRSCDGANLTDGRNGSYRFRTWASDRSGSQASPVLVVKVSNPASTPRWAADPMRADSDDPMVELRWFANPEPDIVEYHFTRSGPDGTREYAVSASHPGGQGCARSGDVYTCVDDDFPSTGFDGTYRYRLLAFRSSPDPSTSCSLPGGGSCAYSQHSSQRSLALKTAPPPRSGTGGDSGGSTTAPPPPPETNPDGSPRRPQRTGPPALGDIVGGADFDFEGGSFDRSLPYANGAPVSPGSFGNQTGGLAADESLTGGIGEQPNDRNLVALASGLLLLVIATHLLRVLKGPAAGSR